MECINGNYGFFGIGSLCTIFYITVLFSGLIYVSFYLINKHQYRNGHLNMNKDKCPNCHCLVEDTYIRCPECHYKLRTNCTICGKVIKTPWDICPYCEGEVKSNPNKIQHQRM